MITKNLNQKKFYQKLEKTIYSRHANTIAQIAKLFALGYYNNLQIYVITKKDGFEVAPYEDIVTVLALIYPGELPCKSVSLRHLFAVIMDDSTKPHVDGITFGVREHDNWSFFVTREKLALEIMNIV